MKALMRASRVLWICFIVAGFEGMTTGQETRGSIVGRVTDTSGAVVPAAVVKATHQQRNVTVESSTNAQGYYQILFLVPGVYQVSATVAGFKSFLRDDVEVRLGDRINLDVTLEVGEVSVAVAVSCPHRAQAFEACRHAIDRLKEVVPIWKKENWADGSTEWVHPGVNEKEGESERMGDGEI